MATVKEIRDASRADKQQYAIDALGRRNMMKDGKRYIESSPGSNRFGNFQSKSAAKAEQEAMAKKKATPTPKAKPTPPTKTTYSAGDHQRGQSTKTTSGKTTSGPPQIGSGGRVMGSIAEVAGSLAIQRRQSARTSEKITGSNIPAVQPPPKPKSGRDKANDRADAFLQKYKQDEANKKLVRENADQVISTVLAFSGGVRRVGQAVFNVGLKAARSTQAGRTAEKYITEGAKKLEAPLRKLTAPQKRLPAPDRPPPKASNSLADKGSVGRWRQKPKPKGGKKGTGTFSSGYAKPPKSLVDKKMGGTARVKPPKKNQRKFTVENDPWQY